MQKTIRQHFVPQTYLKQWGNNNKVFITDVISKKTYKRDCKNIFFLDYLYSIYISLWSEVNFDVKKELLSPLYSYQVYYNNKEITGEELIDNINSFEQFIIKKSGKEISTKGKNDLWGKIINNYSCYIENSFSILETEFADKILKNYKNISNVLISSTEDSSDIIRRIYRLAQNLYARNPYTCYFHFRRIQNEDSLFPQIFKSLQLLELQGYHLLPEGLNMNFLVNETNQEFITSDIPVLLDLCSYYTELGILEGCFLFTLSPKVAIIFSKSSERKYNKLDIKYSISLASTETIDMINSRIKNSCNKFYISSNAPDNSEVGQDSEKLYFYFYNCRGVYELVNKHKDNIPE